MGKKNKFQKKSNLEKEHEEDDLREEDIINQTKKEDYNEENENDNEISEESIESINLEKELNNKLEEIKKDMEKFYEKANRKIKWLDYPVEISEEKIPEYLNPDDDIKRELFFYNIAKENAIKGMIELKNLGEKINRPDDYFVEMLKSDEQMLKVKKQIINEQQYIKKFEAKKQKLQNIKFAKSMKDFQNKQKSNFKKQTMEGVEKWKQHIKKNPNDYKDIDKFFNNKKSKFNPKNKEERFNNRNNKFKKKQMKRPGKMKRIMMKNKNNSKRKNK